MSIEDFRWDYHYIDRQQFNNISRRFTDFFLLQRGLKILHTVVYTVILLLSLPPPPHILVYMYLCVLNEHDDQK